MPIHPKYLANLEESNFYHVYNHASGGENLFANEGNYTHFLTKLDEHLSEYWEVYAFCLMPNHFHLLVRIKSIPELTEVARNYLAKFDNLNDCLIRKCNNFFISYSMAFNKQVNRQGNLFRRPFKRIHVSNEDYFYRLLFYIHFNPVHHRFVKHINDYKWTSFQFYLRDKPSKLPKTLVWDWFKGKDNFLKFHIENDKPTFDDLAEYLIED